MNFGKEKIGGCEVCWGEYGFHEEWCPVPKQEEAEQKKRKSRKA